MPVRTLLFVCNVGWFFLSHRLALAQAAQREGYEVHVACDIDSAEEASAIRAAGLAFHHVAVRRGGANPLADAGTLLSLVALMRRLRPTLVHNVTIKPVLYGSLAARITGVRQVVNAISGLGYVFVDSKRAGVIRKLVHELYRLALQPKTVRVIFQNEQDRGYFVDAKLVEPERTVLIPGSGVDLQQFTPAPEVESERIRIVLPARLLRDKGVVEFCDAAEQLLSKGLSVDCVVAGSLDPSNPAALSEADLVRMEKRAGVSWLGHVDNMPALLRSAHIVCLPSYREGMPKALLEACASGRPVVTTRVPGCQDVVEEGVNGLLVPARDSKALAEALETLVRNRDLRVRMGNGGREIAVARFGVEAVIEGTLRLYDDMLPQRRRS